MAATADAQKLCVTRFKGPGGEAVRAQLADALCSENACVDAKRVTQAGKPNFTKAKKEKVAFFVVGNVKAKGGKKTLELQVLTKPGAAKLKKRFTFSGSTLPAATLDQVMVALNRAMGLEEPEPRKQAEEAPKQEERPVEREPPPSAEPAPTSEPEQEASAPPPAEEPAAPAEPEQTAPARVQPFWVAIEVGLDLFSRSFSYSSPETTNLRSYRAELIAAPTVRAELYPLSLVTEGLIAGLGVDGSFAHAVGLRSRRMGSDLVWPTTLQRFDFSVRWRIRPVDTLDAAIIPFVGYAQRSFSSGAAADGSTLDGLANVSYASIRPGLAGELPISDSGLLVFARFAVHLVLSSGQIISAAADGFFKRGSNFGLEAQLGAGYRIFSLLSIRLAFDFVRYGMGFSPEPTDTYRAAGAVDTYLGGNLALRLSL